MTAEYIRRPASSIDYAKSLTRELPPDRRAYILARYALADRYDEDEVSVMNALITLDKDNTSGVLQPPLVEEVSTEISAYLASIRDGHRHISPHVGNLLLSWALDESVTEKKPFSRKVKDKEVIVIGSSAEKTTSLITVDRIDGNVAYARMLSFGVESDERVEGLFPQVIVSDLPIRFDASSRPQLDTEFLYESPDGEAEGWLARVMLPDRMMKPTPAFDMRWVTGKSLATEN